MDPALLKTQNYFNRDGQIRTDDILVPNQALYQAELRPVVHGPATSRQMQKHYTRPAQQRQHLFRN